MRSLQTIRAEGMTSGPHLSRLLLPGASLLAAGLLLVWPARAQRLGTASGFTLADHYPAPDERQMKSILEGSRGQMMEGNRVLLSDVKLRTFRVSGDAEFQITAPQCLYDPNKRSAFFGTFVTRANTAETPRSNHMNVDQIRTAVHDMMPDIVRDAYPGSGLYWRASLIYSLRHWGWLTGGYLFARPYLKMAAVTLVRLFVLRMPDGRTRKVE